MACYTKLTPTLKKSQDSFVTLTFIMSIIPKEFGPDMSESGARRFVLCRHEPLGQVFTQYRIKSAEGVVRSKDSKHKVLKIFTSGIY